MCGLFGVVRWLVGRILEMLALLHAGAHQTVPFRICLLKPWLIKKMLSHDCSCSREELYAIRDDRR